MGRQRCSWIAAGVIITLLAAAHTGRWSGNDRSRKGLIEVDAVSAATKPGQSVVGIVRSDYARLKHPAAPDAQLTESQIEEMVRWAVMSAGGLQTVIEPDARWIALKVNIVEVTTPDSGAITDPRVVKAVVKLVHEAAPDARISIVEGPGEWIAPDVPGVDTLFVRQKEDGWVVAGYRALLKDPDLTGIQLDLVDLNIDEAILTSVPDQWYAREKYWVPKTVLDCDALIDIPVMKIHDGPGMTCAMKNFVGIAPGLKYGWAKLKGYPGQGPGIPHTPQIIDETIVDLTSLANPKFTVVDAIVGMEKEKTTHMEGRPVRMNTIVAGSDIVAVDATCARLMGLNPDDIEFLTLATRKGLGRMEEEQIKINGQAIGEVGKRFEKPHKDWGIWGEMGHYGQGNRTWLLKGPFPTKDFGQEFIDPKTMQPKPGEDGWSQPVYFSDDRIDLDRFFDGPTDCVVYGYVDLTVPKGGPAELWVGSDEGLAVWIDGKEVYRFTGTRRHKLPNDRVPVTLTDGEHRLLIKAGQSHGRYELSLNICEPETDPRYDGNRLKGLKFRVPVKEQGEIASVRAEEIVKPSSQVKMIEGAKWLMNPTTIVGAIEGGLRAMGDTTCSTAYLMGITGHAFRLTVSDSLSWDDPGIDRLVDMTEALRFYRNLGYDFEMVSGNEKEVASLNKLQMIWERVRRDIDRGVPVLLHRWGVWLIRGYDPRKETYLVSEWSEEEFLSFDEIADERTGEFAVIFFGDRHPANKRDAEMASLRFAVEHAYMGDTDSARYSNGLRAYDRWIGALQNNTASHQGAHAFHTMLLLGARHHAAAYLDTLAGEYDKETAVHLRKAAEFYRKEAESLTALNQIFGFDSPGKPDRVKDAASRKEGVALLKEALRWEKMAIGEIEKVVRYDDRRSEKR